MPEISVIMLMHNRERYARQMIECILAQTYGDFEFIIIDNASSDGSLEIAQGYAAKDSRIRVLQRESSDIGGARNLGLDTAQGGFFAFVDDDDYCAPDYLEFLCKLAREHEADIAVCGSNYDIDGQIKPKYVFDELVLCDCGMAVENFLLRRYYNSGNPAKLFRRTPEINKVRYTESGRYDDIHTMYKFFAAAGTQRAAVAAKGEPKYTFRRHEGNNSTVSTDFSGLTPEWLAEYLAAYRERTQYISRKLPNLTGTARWSEWSFMISMAEKIRRYHIDGCDEMLAHMMQELERNHSDFMESPLTRDFEKQWMESYCRI